MKTKTVSFDWAHIKQKQIYYDGKKHSTKLPENTTTILTENCPDKFLNEFKQKKIQVLGVYNHLVKDYRNQLGLEKTDKNDAKCIYELYKTRPELYREYIPEPRITHLVRNFKQLQKIRISTNNRYFAYPNQINKRALKRYTEFEKELIKDIKNECKFYEIYTKWLSKVKGVGPATGGYIISTIKNIDKFDNISKLWAYFGLHVTNGKAPKKTKGQMSNWHQEGRAMLLGVLAESFIKQRTPTYRKIYEEEKAKQIKKHLNGECQNCNKLKTQNKPGHPDRMAKRKMIKIFIQDLWIKWRTLEGLPITLPYAEAYLGHTKEKLRV